MEIATGSIDLPLLPEGYFQSLDVGTRFQKDGGIDLLASSPMRRAQQTAHALKTLNPDAVTVDLGEGLRPWSLGAIEGYPEEYVNKMLPQFIKNPDRALAGRSKDSSMDGESFNGWASTYFPTIKALMRYSQANPDHKVVAVTHSRNMAFTHDWLKKGQPSDYSQLVLNTKKINSDGIFKVGAKGMSAVDSVKEPGFYLVEHGRTEHSA